MEQPSLLVVPPSWPAGTSGAGGRAAVSGPSPGRRSPRSEWAKRVGLAGVAEARAALAAAAERAEAERATARAAGRAA